MTGLSKAAWLVETSGERAGRMHSIGPEAVTIGRADDNAIVVRHANASRRHARIWHDGERWLIEDLGTKNGTLRNGEAVAEPTALQESDEIALPGFSATFHTTDETIVVAVPAVRPSSTKTFLFTDLRGYTAFTEQHGDAAASEIVAEYRRLVRSEIARTGGRERTTEGDSFFVVFDSAHSAVECALAIVRACAEHTARAGAPHPRGRRRARRRARRPGRRLPRARGERRRAAVRERRGGRGPRERRRARARAHRGSSADGAARRPRAEGRRRPAAHLRDAAGLARLRAQVRAQLRDREAAVRERVLLLG